MKTAMLASTAITGAVVWLAGVSAQPPAAKPVTPPPPTDLPSDDAPPAVAKPMKPLTLTPRALRKKEAMEQKGPASEMDEPVPPTSRRPPLPKDDVADPPPRTPRKPLDDGAPGKPAEKSAPAVKQHLEDDDDGAPGTASVRRSRRDVNPTPTGDLVADASRKIEQSLSLEWACQANIKAKQPFTCEMIVRNNGVEPAMNVVVRSPMPDGFKMTSAEPKPGKDDELMTWNLGTLNPKQERRVRMEMIAERRGELACRAMVSATTPAAAQFKVTEPQLVVKQSCPEKAMVGDVVPVSITISNPGDGPTDSVVVRARMSDGLKGDKGQEMVNDVGVLAAGESRVLKLVCQSLKGGAHKIVTTATAEGLTHSAESTTSISEPRMEIAMAGPKLRYLDRSATYTVTVSNPGDAVASDVKVNVSVPVGFKTPTPTQGGKFDASTRTIAWTIGTLNPGEKKEVTYKCAASQIGEHKHAATGEAARGLRSASDVVTKVEGIASLLVELADVDDPIEVGSETSYEVRVTNHGSAPATNVEIRALIPKEMTIKSCTGPTEFKVEGQEVLFSPIPKLAPKADAVYRVLVKANAVADVRFRARLASDTLSEPVIGEEGTKIYGEK